MTGVSIYKRGKGEVWTLVYEQREDDEKTQANVTYKPRLLETGTENGMDSPSQSTEGVNPTDTLILDIWPPEL